MERVNHLPAQRQYRVQSSGFSSLVPVGMYIFGFIKRGNNGLSLGLDSYVFEFR